MHRSFRLTPALIVALASLVLAPASFAAMSDTVHPRSEQELARAARAAGIAVNTTEMVELFRDGVNFSGAPMAGLESIPARELANGVDVAFIHLDAPSSGIPAGDYVVRAQSNATGVTLGENEVTVDLVSTDGSFVVTQTGVANVWSQTVPSNPPYPNSVAGVALDMPNPAIFRIVLRIWIFCPNGWVICFDIVLFSFPF
jgi:hypothetical protein